MIIGGSGAGKTWLAKRLGHQLQLPVYSVDDAVWDTQGRLRPADEIDQIVRSLALKQSWIIEGGNSRTYGDRADRAQLIIRMALPLWLRFIRVLMRSGPQMKLLHLTIQYDAIFGEKDIAVIANANKNIKTVEIRSRREVTKLLKIYKEQGAASSLASVVE